MLLLRAARAQARRSYATAISSGNGFKIAASDFGQATASISLVLKAGTRYETKPGVASVFKGYAFKSNQNRTSLGTVREAELYGGVLSSSLSRENITLTAEFLKGDEDYFASVLASVLETKFTPHELEEQVLPSILSESSSALQNPTIAALEAAHVLAFRSGLAAPLYLTAGAHGISSGDAKDYAQKVFGSDMAVIGTGISQEALEKLVSKHFPTLSSSGSTTSDIKTTYHGGESRLPSPPHSNGSAIFIGFAVPSAITGTPELSVLQGLLTPEPSVKWGTSTSPIASANTVQTQVLLLPYTDASLFGLVLTGEGEALKQSATRAVTSLKALSSNGGVKKEELTKAIAKAKYGLGSAIDTREGFVSAVGNQLLSSNGSQTTLESHLAAVEKVSAAGLSKFVGSIFKNKPTYVAVGDRAPWADEIGL